MVGWTKESVCCRKLEQLQGQNSREREEGGWKGGGGRGGR